MDDDGSYQFAFPNAPQPGQPEPSQNVPNAYATPQPDQPAVTSTPMPDVGGAAPPPDAPTIFTGLSGNEMYCLNLVGYRPGNLVVGNSVYALGFIGGLASNIRTNVGGEIKQYTNMISEGRRLSYQRLEQELVQNSGEGATGVTSEVIFHPGNIEFLSVGSTIHRQDNQTAKPITTSSDGQEFYCQVDAGYFPMRFVFGNVAYSIGIGRSFLGELKELTKGEIKQFSDIFNITRNAALQRITDEAREIGANAVTGIRTSIIPIGPQGVQEMIMVGTAAYNPQLTQVSASVGGILTSDLTEEEMWNVTKMGYVPLRLILGTSVYSLGVVGGIRAAIRGYIKGEITTLTQLIYGAREESLKKVQQQAEGIGADDVLGIKTYIYQLGNGVIEFLAIGTAVKRVNGVTPHSDQLPPQAIIRDKNTFINTADTIFGENLNRGSTNTTPQNPQQHTV